MTVFKGYMIIIKRNLAFLFLYGGIFFSIMMGVQGAATKTDTAVYEKTNLNIAVIDEDGSAFSKGMAEALDKEHTIITDVTEQRDLAEELYYWRMRKHYYSMAMLHWRWSRGSAAMVHTVVFMQICRWIPM